MGLGAILLAPILPIPKQTYPKSPQPLPKGHFRSTAFNTMPHIVDPEINGSDFTKVIHNDTYPAIDPAKGDHTGHAVFITGASSGIGLTTAHSFARTGASHIALSSIEPFPSDVNETLVQAAKSASRTPEILTFHLDVLDESSITSAVTAIKESFGKLDILVNNAGYMAVPSPIISSNDSTCRRKFEINLRGTYRVTKAFLPLLLSSPSKASAYETSKFAVLRWTDFLVEENREAGLIVMCVHPGAVMTELAEAMPKDTHLTDTPALAADTITFLAQGRREWLGGRNVSCQ
ncbi:NAD(P)-binding protein [Acephala macrosclerotiorum]|nr:NAD(P)-binding protein [Acephala macrosclerotiorum]